MKENNMQSFRLDVKKNIVLAICSLVLIGTMGISLWKQAPEEQVVQKEETSMNFVRKNMEETATATNLYMNYAEVEQGDEGSVGGSNKNSEETDVSEEESDIAVSKGPDDSKSALVSSDKDKKGGSVGKKPSKSLSVTYQEISESTAKSGPKKSGKSTNRVVSDVSRTGVQGNRVVENPEPSNYIEKVFENHGIAPVIGEVLKKYQYPVEIGYSYDKNYDGNNDAGDFILNKIYDTKEYEEESTEEESEKDSDAEDPEKQEEDRDESEREEEDDKADESENAEENKEGTKDSQGDEENRDSEKNSEDKQEDTLNNEVSGDAVVEQETNSEDVQDSTVSGDAILNEQKKLEEYRKDIWKQIMPTAPVDVEIEKKVMKTTPVDKSKKEKDPVTENKTESTSEQKSADETMESKEQASGDAKEKTEESSEGTSQEDGSVEVTETTEDEAMDATTEAMVSGDATPIVETESVAGYYIIKGKMREGSKVYVSDITILPAGVDGFDKVRLGQDGEFKDSIVLTTDVMNRTIELYFTDGETVTEPAAFTYSKDTVTPELQWMEEEYTLLESAHRKIYCTKENELPIKIVDGEENEDATLESVQYLYGTKLQSIAEGLDSPKLSMNEDFYGRLLVSCRDKAGNTSDIQSQFVLVDHNTPAIQIAQDERCSAPYSLWVNVEETGHIVSGIQTIQCVVDGKFYEISESMVRETYTLDEGLEVSSKLTFPVELTEVGIHAVSIRVRDYAGNEAVVEQVIEVTEPELVSIYMPRNFTIHIDPQQLAGKEQIYSDNVELKNVSKFDVRVNIDNIVLNVNDEMSADGVLKDCDIYLIAPDTGEKIKLSKGENENIYSYCLPVEAVGDLANLRFVGTTTAGSERMWKGSDISLSLQVSFIKWEEK